MLPGVEAVGPAVHPVAVGRPAGREEAECAADQRYGGRGGVDVAAAAVAVVSVVGLAVGVGIVEGCRRSCCG